MSEFSRLILKGATASELANTFSVSAGEVDTELKAVVRSVLEMLLTFDLIWTEAHIRPLQKRSQRFRSQDVALLSRIPSISRGGFLGIEKLKKARVVVVGCGSLGAPISRHLLLSGIGELILVDGDVIELRNLSRLDFCGESDVGKAKTDILHARLSNISSITNIVSIKRHLASHADVRELIDSLGEIQLIVLTADEPAFKIVRWFSKISRDYAIPLLRANSLGIGPIYDSSSASPCPCCWDLPRHREYSAFGGGGSFFKKMRERPSTGGSIFPAMAAALASHMAIDFLAGIDNLVLATRRYNIDHESGTISHQDITKNRKCSICQK